MVFLCEGDPLLYGSFAHLVERLGTRFECEAVPGHHLGRRRRRRDAPAAGPARAAVGDHPGDVPPRRLEALLKDHERVVILKIGRHLAKVRQALGGARMLKSALLVENVTTAGQRIRPLQEVGEEAAPYFSLVLASREPQQQR